MSLAAYTATEVQTTGAARSTATRSSSDHSDSPNIAPIVGGVVGSVIALGLLG